MVERADIEAKAREIQEALAETRDAAQGGAVRAAIALGVVVLVAFVLGRRKGRRSKAVVEVYKV